MAKFKQKSFFQLCLDAEGKAVEKDTNVRSVVLMCLRTDLTTRTPHSLIPDIHENKKYEIYQLIKKVIGIEDTDSDVVIESDEIILIKERAQKIINFEAYGFICDFLEGKNG